MENHKHPTKVAEALSSVVTEMQSYVSKIHEGVSLEEIFTLITDNFQLHEQMCFKGTPEVADFLHQWQVLYTVMAPWRGELMRNLLFVGFQAGVRYAEGKELEKCLGDDPE